MRDSIEGFFIVVGAIIGVYAFGSLIGLAIGLAAKEYSSNTPPTLWYCIEGKVYEKNGDYYATVVPPRACVPVSKD